MSYATDIDLFLINTQRRLLSVVKGVASQTHLYAVEHTPIDTGRAVSSWNITEGEIANLDATPELGGRQAPAHHPAFLGFRETPVKGGSPLNEDQAISIALRQQENLASLSRPMVTISNNVPYIEVLELGYRGYVGHYMLHGAANNFQVYVADAVASLP